MSQKNAKFNRRMIKKYGNTVYQHVYKEIEQYGFFRRLKYLITGKIT